MAAAAMHARGPGPARHLSIFQITRSSLQQLAQVLLLPRREWCGSKRARASEQDVALASIPRAPSCPCHHRLQVGGFWGGGGGWLCVNQPAKRIQYTVPSPGTALWNPPPPTTALTSSAGLHCTLPFPGSKAGKPGRTERCGARSGTADESEPRPRPVDDDLHSTLYMVGIYSYCISPNPRVPFLHRLTGRHIAPCGIELLRCESRAAAHLAERIAPAHAERTMRWSVRGLAFRIVTYRHGLLQRAPIGLLGPACFLPQAHQWPIPQPSLVGPASPSERCLSVRPPPSHNHRSWAELGLRSGWARAGRSLPHGKYKAKAKPAPAVRADRTGASSDGDRVAQQLRSSPCSWPSLLTQTSQRLRTTGVKLPSQTKQGPGSRAHLVLACDKGGPILPVLIGWPHELGLTVTLRRRM